MNATNTFETPTAAPTQRLYLIRAVIALVWAGLLIAALASGGSLTPDEPVPAFAIALLIIYPVIDVVASLIDARTQRTNAPAQLVNAGISTVTAVVIAVTASHGADALLRTFGAWAILTGLIQLVLAVLRWRRGTAGQLPMVLSGGISTLAGSGFVMMSAQDDLSLVNLAGYATLGAVFYLVSVWRLRSQRTAAVTRSTTRTGA